MFNKSLQILGLGIVSATIAVGVSPVHAAVVTNGCQAVDYCTLQELFNGGTIEVGGLYFSNWILNENIYNDTGVEIDLEKIPVLGIFEDTNAPGIRYITDIDTLVADSSFNGQGLSAYLDFSYTVTSKSPLKIEANTLELTGFEIGSDFVFIQITENVKTSQQGSELAQKEVLVEINPFSEFENEQLIDTATFSPQKTVWVNTAAYVGVGQGLAAITGFRQNFSQVPEPLTIFGTGTAVGIGALFRRKLNNKKKR